MLNNVALPSSGHHWERSSGFFEPRISPIKHPLIGKDGESNGTPLQYSCPENPMDGGAW